jgi:DNA primase
MDRHDPAEVARNLNIEQLYGSILQRFRRTTPRQAMGLCPFHEDKNPSCSVNLANGLFNCFGCGAKGDVFSFWQKMYCVDFKQSINELALQAGMVTPMMPKVVAVFTYRSDSGSWLYAKERIEPGRDGRKKEFRFFHFEGGENGAVNAKKISGRGGEPVLYRLHEVVQAKAVIIVEGEAKAGLLAGWGLTATTLDSGSQSRLTDKQAAHLEGKRICILPDNDDAGQTYADNIVAKLRDKVPYLKVVSLPGVLEKGDIIDWARLSDKNNRESLLALIKSKDTDKEIEEIALKYSALSEENQLILRRSWKKKRDTMRSTALATW